MTELVQKFPCPYCFVSVRMSEKGQAATCLGCHNTLEVIGHLCVDCGTYHLDAAPLCETCGSPMTKVCRLCQTVNWSGDFSCQNCDAGLDVIETLTHHSTEGTTAVAQQKMRQAHIIKEQEATHSAQRMAQMSDREEARQAELRRRQKIIHKQERQMWLKVGAIIVIVLLISIFVMLLS